MPTLYIVQAMMLRAFVLCACAHGRALALTFLTQITGFQTLLAHSCIPTPLQLNSGVSAMEIK